MIARNKSLAEIAEALVKGWYHCIKLVQPWNVLELGTGQGASGNEIMSALPSDAHFTTINYVDGHVFGVQLESWRSDSRYLRIDADTIDVNTMSLVRGGVDLLYIDTTHEAWHAATELRMWQHMLQNGAIVVADDLNHHDMIQFWDGLPYDKFQVPNSPTCQGVFRYDASILYNDQFNRPEKTTYGGKK